MIEAKITSKLIKLLKDGQFEERAKTVVGGAMRIIEGEYKREAPVDKGFLRSGIQSFGTGLDRFVTTTTTNRGRRYPIDVNQGTGIFKNVETDYPSTGRVRAGTTAKGIGGIRPNKFVRRAEEKAEPKVTTYFVKKINDMINQF